MLRRLSLLAALFACASCSQAQLKFSVTYPNSAFRGPFSGRVVVYLGKAGQGEPRFGPDWFNPQPMYSAKFSHVPPGQAMVISDSNDIGFPGKLARLPAGDYTVQAVVDRNLGGRALGTSPGNLYSSVVSMHLDPAFGPVSLVCAHVVPQPTFTDTRHVKFFEVKSKLLSEFYGRDTYVKGAAILPDEWYSQPARKFPVLYEVPGFGGDVMQLSGRDFTRQTVVDGVPFVVVFLDPNVPTGHCVFADSANNGPWGKALTTEYIPAVERKFRCMGKAGARFVTGHSSGGWSSLWLQVAYPDVFGGVWSTSPDPVDFHLFQLIDIYKPGANAYYDVKGNLIPVARMNGRAALFVKNFCDMERPIRGEQLGSFDAVFSPKGADGEPEMLWNRDTGAIDPIVADAWKKYDIALKLRKEWPTLGPKLKGKLHVFCGTEDTFYLDGAVRLLQAEMKGLGSDAEVEMVPGDHFTMMSPALQQKIAGEMAASLKRLSQNSMQAH